LKFGPHFLETGELWSKYFSTVESPQEALQAAQSLWAKVEKQKSYGGSNSDDNSNFLEIGELWSTYFDVVGKL